MPEKTVKFYSAEPVQMEWSRDGVTWTRVAHYDEAPAEGCKQAKVNVESGWIRAKYLLGHPENYGTVSNAIAVPEPLSVGLLAGALALCALGRRRRAC
jgi:hypothetical protein